MRIFNAIVELEVDQIINFLKTILCQTNFVEWRFLAEDNIPASAKQQSSLQEIEVGRTFQLY